LFLCVTFSASGVSNKPGGFSQADVDFLQPFLVTCSNLLYAFTQAEDNKRLEAKFTADPDMTNGEQNDNTRPTAQEGSDVAAKMKSMVSQNRRPQQHLDSKPLAELYLETTVICCNITGFTSWASTREPSQVFTLLETGALFVRFQLKTACLSATLNFSHDCCCQCLAVLIGSLDAEAFLR
jgi:hypothetical protein